MVVSVWRVLDASGYALGPHSIGSPGRKTVSPPSAVGAGHTAPTSPLPQHRAVLPHTIAAPLRGPGSKGGTSASGRTTGLGRSGGTAVKMTVQRSPQSREPGDGARHRAGVAVTVSPGTVGMGRNLGGSPNGLSPSPPARFPEWIPLSGWLVGRLSSPL